MADSVINEKLLASEISKALMMAFAKKDKGNISPSEIAEILKKNNIIMSKFDSKNVEKFLETTFKGFQKTDSKNMDAFLAKVSKDFAKEFGASSKEIVDKLDELKGSFSKLFDSGYFKHIRTMNDIQSDLKTQLKYLNAETKQFGEELTFISKGKNSPLITNLASLNTMFEDFFKSSTNDNKELINNQVKLFELTDVRMRNVNKSLDRYAKLGSEFSQGDISRTAMFMETQNSNPLTKKGVLQKNKSVEKQLGGVKIGAMQFENKTSALGSALGLGFLQRKGKAGRSAEETAMENRIQQLAKMDEIVSEMENLKYSLLDKLDEVIAEQMGTTTGVESSMSEYTTLAENSIGGNSIEDEMSEFLSNTKETINEVKDTLHGDDNNVEDEMSGYILDELKEGNSANDESILNNRQTKMESERDSNEQQKELIDTIKNGNKSEKKKKEFEGIFGSKKGSIIGAFVGKTVGFILDVFKKIGLGILAVIGFVLNILSFIFLTKAGLAALKMSGGFSALGQALVKNGITGFLKTFIPNLFKVLLKSFLSRMLIIAPLIMMGLDFAEGSKKGGFWGGVKQALLGDTDMYKDKKDKDGNVMKDKDGKPIKELKGAGERTVDALWNGAKWGMIGARIGMKFGGPIGGLVGGVIGLVFGIFSALWEDLEYAIGGFAKWCAGIFTGWIDGLKQKWKIFTDAFKGFLEIFKKFGESVKGIWSDDNMSIKDKIKGIWNGFTEMMNNLWDRLGLMVTDFMISLSPVGKQAMRKTSFEAQVEKKQTKSIYSTVITGNTEKNIVDSVKNLIDNSDYTIVQAVDKYDEWTKTKYDTILNSEDYEDERLEANYVIEQNTDLVKNMKKYLMNQYGLEGKALSDAMLVAFTTKADTKGNGKGDATGLWSAAPNSKAYTILISNSDAKVVLF